MNTLLYISIFGFLSCNNQTQQSDKKQSIDTTAKVEISNKIENSKYYTTVDTLIIATEIGDTLKYAKDEFNEIIDNHPELVSDNIQNPDQVYHCSGEKKGFNSEAGQDEYFMLYAYFLKSKNGERKYSERRKKLIDIFLNINSLFGHVEYGGTYFGHQQARILGYAEFSVYLYKQNETYGISKTYDITKQKELYIKSLRQLINDESKIDFNTTGQEKIERTKELNIIVDEIDKSITDNYYLRRTQDFHYGHYEYY
jgi:hypothetical protein